MTNKDKYQQFCKKEPIPVFSQHWWLDSVCINGQWDVALIEKNGEIVASMPYYLKKSGLLKQIVMPPLTQTMGPYITYPDGQKYSKKLSYEKEIMNNLIDQLPSVDYFCQNFHSSITNWLPFYWRGFKQSTRYTYILNTKNENDSFQSNIKTDIKKAQKKVEINASDSIEEVWHCLSKTFSRQNKKPPYSKQFLQTLDNQLNKENSCKKLVAIDNEGNIHAAILLVISKNTVYYLIGGGDPKFRNSGATSLLINNGIEFAKKHELNFDFEGSMIEPIEKFFRGFGSIQTPYFEIKKINSKRLKCKELFKAMLN